ncbi:HipA-like C-terminal domain-containing protein [Paracidovorax wautersii]|uniref:HipA-like C-terminal domain-containing protein n=1 Tax=Paracidovorax wautersii TaxID=1177982 RepID=A0A1I2DCJ5_9BURK|nr:HipA-like C-terminal domain-containing protein [Paracidovorax wautersii]
MAHCTDPQAEVLEYLRRDVANIALGNKDNHACNTALQRDWNGRIALTPLFDFAPMYLHPDGIARRIRCDGNDGGQPDWRRVIDTVCASAGPRLDPGALRRGLQAMAEPLARIAEEGPHLGLESDVHASLQPGLVAMAERLARLQ